MIKKSLATHDGSFHADEVTAASLLLLFGLIDKENIIRTRDDEKIKKCEYVCDVGGIYDPKQKRFDHHQVSYKGPLSSAGMILEYLRDEGIIPHELYHHFNSVLVQGVDAHDNGRAKLEMGVATFSQIISNFMPISYSASEKELGSAFFEAVDFVVEHLTRLKMRFFYIKGMREVVERAMQTKELFLLFDESLPWMENFFSLKGEEHPALFVVMPTENHWKVRGIPPNLKDRMSVRKPQPKSWLGLQNEELEKVSKIPGAIFCHKGGFISIWKTKEAALQAVAYILQK